MPDGPALRSSRKVLKVARRHHYRQCELLPQPLRLPDIKAISKKFMNANDLESMGTVQGTEEPVNYTPVNLDAEDQAVTV